MEVGMNWYLFISLLIASITTIILLNILTPLAKKVGLLDVADCRKTHKGAIPLIGGIAIFGGVLIASIIYFSMTMEIVAWLVAGAMILILGIFDDAWELSAKFRLVIQSVIVLLLCLFSGQHIENLGSIIGLGDLLLGKYGYIITLLAVIGGINAFNMMDGLDGLAGSIALVSLIGLAILFNRSNDNVSFAIVLIIIVSLLPYLQNNILVFPFKNKIFMGDAGSMLIGFSIVWLLIRGSQSSAGFYLSFSPATALWLIALPLMDMVAIMGRRVYKGRSPFVADTDHLHHKLIKRGYSSQKVLLILVLLSVFFLLVGMFGEYLDVLDYVMFLVFLMVFVVYVWVVSWLL